MFDMIPFRKQYKQKDEFFSPFLDTFFNDEFFSLMTNLQGNFKVDLKETDENYLIEADLPGVKKKIVYQNKFILIHYLPNNTNFINSVYNLNETVEPKEDVSIFSYAHSQFSSSKVSMDIFLYPTSSNKFLYNPHYIFSYLVLFLDILHFFL